MLSLLGARAPHPSRREGLMQFGQFVGTWDVQVRFFDPGGARVYDEPGVWSFGWVLDGLAVQDVLVYPSLQPRADGTRERRMGSTLRAYEPQTDTWRIFWVGASSGIVLDLRARAQGAELLIEGLDADGGRLRWMFTEVTPDSFQWKGFKSTDAGKSWYLEQEMLGRRRSSTHAQAE
jgi:hypothetical protein